MVTLDLQTVVRFVETNRTRGINAKYGAIRFEWGCHPHLEHLRPSEIMPCDSAELSGISALHTVIFNHAHIVLSNQELDIAWDAEQCSTVICSAMPSTVRLRGGGPLIGDTNEQAAGAPDPDHAQVCRVVPDPSQILPTRSMPRFSRSISWTHHRLCSLRSGCKGPIVPAAARGSAWFVV